MENEHVIAGLIRKRAELAGQLEAAQIAVRQLIIDLDNVDATLRLFQPDIDLEIIRPKPLPPRHAAYKGEISRTLLSALRETAMAMTTKDLAFRLMSERHLNMADTKMVWTIQKRVGASLRHLRKRGTVVSGIGRGSNLQWRLADNLGKLSE